MDLKHICKFCKKSYPCGRSLGGHIRSHLTKNKKNSGGAHNEKPKLSKPGFELGSELRLNTKKTNKVTTTKLNSSPSSFSTGSEPEPELDTIKSNKKKNNSMRRSSVNNEDDNSNSVSSVSEMEQDEVAIAMCLIMLSRDVGIDRGNLSSINDQFSDQILLFEAKNNTKKRSKRENNQVKCSVSSVAINKKNKNLKFTPSGSSQNGSKLKGVEVSATGFALKDHSNMSSESKKADREVQNGFKMKELNVLQDGVASIDRNDKFSMSKRKIGDAYEDGFGLNDRKSDNHESNAVENDMNSDLFNKDFDNKRSKFGCTTCNKVFNSYQALGGHRASHKRLLEAKNSLVSKLESSDMSKDENVDANNHNQQQFVAEIGIGSSKKSNQKHECPICFRVFPSGQALGGHKRSHLLATNGNTNMISETKLVDKSSNCEITRDLLDLNLPPITIEEDTIATTIATASSSNSVAELMKPYWWVDSSNEPFSNLIEN